MDCNYHLVVESQWLWAFCRVFVQPPPIYEIIIAMTDENEESKIKNNKKQVGLEWNTAIGHASSFFEALHRRVVLRLQCASASLLFRMLTWRTKRGRRGHVTHTTRGPVPERVHGNC